MILVTSEFNLRTAPLSIAFSINLTVSSKGETIPAVGAKSAPQTSLERFGSRAKVSSLVKILVSTPFSKPLF